MKTKNRRRNREAFAEHSYWQSYSDMMAALLLIFVLIIAITLAIYKQKTVDLEQSQNSLGVARQELEDARKDLEDYRAAIEKSNEELASSLAELQQAYANAALTQDELNKAYLEIENARNELTATQQELENIVGIRTDIIGALQSAFNNSALTTDSQTTLQGVIPMYLDVLLQDRFRDYIAEIIIEGHTDTDGSYEMNMELSYDRAYSVAKFCMDSRNGLTEEKIDMIEKIAEVLRQ